ncbi:PREDICTED: importin-5-like [Nicotiana attenuata]|uniref:importin-5-like n=1 Tax=Nicotiana attenuata TaxID=49451 RepID=UPI000904A91C|nr:PREDICTED: importin-5-like [Nicotiana attenuata]
MASPESAKKLFGPDPYPMINLLSHLHCDDDHLYQPAKTLFNYTKNHYPTALILKLFEMIQRNPLSITGIRCYYLLRDLLPSLWLRLPPFTRKDLKIGLNYRLWLEKDYETLKACVSCVASLAGLLFPKNEWDDLFYFMFRKLGSSCLYRRLGALLLWNDLIPICPEVFMPYIDFLIEGFKDLMPTVTEDHRCGVAAAKASVKLVLYLGNTANYSKFYDLMAYVMMTLFMALGEEVLVCSLLEDLIILAGAETEFFKVQIDVVIDSMVKIVGNLELEEKTRQLGIEFVLTVAEDKENGCGMMQKIDKDVVSKLLSELIVMLVHIEDDPNWGNAISDDENGGELSMCSYAMESLDRLAIALGGNVILSSCPECLFNFLYDENWRIRHAAVTAIGLISEGCSKALLQEMGQLVETVVMLIHDTHPRVRWATIHAIGQLSKYLSPHFQEQYHQQILPALREVLDDFDNPRLQTRATSAILLFTRNCSSDVLKPYLQRIVSKLLVFLQRGMTMMKEAALATLASLAISSQDSAYIYDSIMPYLKVIMVTATKDTSRMLLTKSLECITTIAMAVGNLAILDYVEKVNTDYICPFLCSTHIIKVDCVSWNCQINQYNEHFRFKVRTI